MNQAEASRINGARSSGPATAEGKAKSAQNASKHALTGGTVVLPHESQAKYDALLDSFIKRFRPSDEIELDLLEEMAASRWRLRRIEGMETALIQQAINQQMEALGDEADPALARELAYAELLENSKGLRLLNRYAKDLRRSYEKAMKELIELKLQTPEVPEALPEPDYSVLRNEPGHRVESFRKAIQPYIQQQEIALGGQPQRRSAA
jgi:hypothetical protein